MQNGYAYPRPKRNGRRAESVTSVSCAKHLPEPKRLQRNCFGLAAWTVGTAVAGSWRGRNQRQLAAGLAVSTRALPVSTDTPKLGET
jgi:hypothetical protein